MFIPNSVSNVVAQWVLERHSRWCAVTDQPEQQTRQRSHVAVECHTQRVAWSLECALWMLFPMPLQIVAPNCVVCLENQYDCAFSSITPYDLKHCPTGECWFWSMKRWHFETSLWYHVAFDGQFVLGIDPFGQPQRQNFCLTLQAWPKPCEPHCVHRVTSLTLLGFVCFGWHDAWEVKHYNSEGVQVRCLHMWTVVFEPLHMSSCYCK